MKDYRSIVDRLKGPLVPVMPAFSEDERLDVYDRVEVELTTHDADGLTGRDFALARAMDDLASR